MAQEDRSHERRTSFEPEMVSILSGPFLMGSLKSDLLRGADEPEQRELNLDEGAAAYLRLQAGVRRPKT